MFHLQTIFTNKQFIDMLLQKHSNILIHTDTLNKWSFELVIKKVKGESIFNKIIICVDVQSTVRLRSILK